MYSSFSLSLRFTAATAGMRVVVKPKTLWPALWSYPAACGTSPCDCALVSESLCNDELVMNVDYYFPCDRQDTPDITELCIEPQALIQAPTEISECRDTLLTLDASASTRAPGAGIKELAFRWATPRSHH